LIFVAKYTYYIHTNEICQKYCPTNYVYVHTEYLIMLEVKNFWGIYSVIG